MGGLRGVVACNKVLGGFLVGDGYSYEEIGV